MDTSAISDGYHTFAELYEYRMLYNALAANAMPDKATKSWRHSDGELCFGGGWFVVVLDLPAGQVTKPLPSQRMGSLPDSRGSAATLRRSHAEGGCRETSRGRHCLVPGPIAS